MKSQFALVSFVVALSVGCSGYGSRASNTNSVQNAGPSSGDYDISSSGSSSSNKTDVNIGGGGGGSDGAQTLITVPVTQNIALKQAEQSETSPVGIDRKIIRNAELNLESDSPEESQKKITSIAESKGGFVVESQQSSNDVRSTTRDIVVMTVRVPAAKFNEALDEIRNAAKRVIVETVKGEDVTEEFIDIEARLRAKKALELQFMEIMKRANTVDDALSVQSQLAEVRGEIEKIEGRKRFLENRASLSTIKIRLQTPTALSSSSSGFSYRLAESFSNGLDVALSFILGLVTFVVAILPLAVIIGLPGYFIVRHIWRKQNRPKSVSEIAKDEISG